MTLLPESIQAANTTALEETFRERIAGLAPGQLLIDLAEENNPVKLGLWLEMFGIPSELLPENLNEFTFRELLQAVLRIYNLSGTPVSIQLIASALGAGNVETATDVATPRYDGGSTHSGLCCYRETDFRTFAADLHLEMPEEKRAEFENLFRTLFYTFQPVGLHLRHINYKGIFDKTFDPIFD